MAEEGLNSNAVASLKVDEMSRRLDNLEAQIKANNDGNQGGN